MVVVSKLDWRLFQAWYSLIYKDPSDWICNFIEITKQQNNSVILRFAPMELLSFLWWNLKLLHSKILPGFKHFIFYINSIWRIWHVLDIYSVFYSYHYFNVLMLIFLLYSYIEFYNLQSAITYVIFLSLTTYDLWKVSKNLWKR